MIGRFRERQYQQTAQRRNEASAKSDYYRETARYFSLECDKARQFTAWTTEPSSKPNHLEISRKADLLVSRQNKLRELLRSEEVQYRVECDRLKSRRSSPRVNFSSEAFDNRLKERLAETSLYQPRTSRRIQSYLYGAYGPSSTTSRPVLRELNNPPITRTRMNMERTEQEEQQRAHDQDDYNKRQDEYKENSRSARASSIYGPESKAAINDEASENYQHRSSEQAAGMRTDGSDNRQHENQVANDNYGYKPSAGMRTDDSDYRQHTNQAASARASSIYGPESKAAIRDEASENYQHRASVPAAGMRTDGSDNRQHTNQVASANYVYKPAAGLRTDAADHRPHTRRLHDSHFLLGNQTHLQEEGGQHKGPNQKFTDRYANRSLEATNVGETAAHSMEETDDLASEADNAPDHDDEGSQTDNRAWNEEGQDQGDYQRGKRDIHEDDQENGHRSSNASMNDNASSDSGNQNMQSVQDQDEADRSEQRDIDKEFDAKASAGRSDHRHFESEKSMPWLRMIPGDKNLSEQMFLYLTHNELKEKIQDLEKRENQAASKHQWDEALRLRDMRNRLDLAREKNLYRRDDLLLDPELKRIGMAGIEARSKLLKEREILCTNSSMYSEEAKVLWSQWLVEDQNSVLEGARVQREDLMKQLEENWRSLAIEDKQKISDSFNKEYIDAAIQQDLENLSAVRSASR